MKKIMLLVLLLFIPLVFAEDTQQQIMVLTDIEGMHVYEPTQECMDEWNMFMHQQPEEMISKYCSHVGMRVLVLLGLVSLMWLAEPKVHDYFENNKSEYFPKTIVSFLYKWIGLGLLFIAMYAIWMVK